MLAKVFGGIRERKDGRIAKAGMPAGFAPLDHYDQYQS